jgi:hypothetical protein
MSFQPQKSEAIPHDTVRVAKAAFPLEMLGETLRAALNSLAVATPEWLVAQIPVLVEEGRLGFYVIAHLQKISSIPL